MNTYIEGKLMEIDVNDWEMEGKKGKSYKLVIYCEKVLYMIRIKEEKVKEYAELIGQNITVHAKIFINGKYTLTAIEE